jgi:hypothetical protein
VGKFVGGNSKLETCKTAARLLPTLGSDRWSRWSGGVGKNAKLWVERARDRRPYGASLILHEPQN